jgi:hypothetical protein
VNEAVQHWGCNTDRVRPKGSEEPHPCPCRYYILLYCTLRAFIVGPFILALDIYKKNAWSKNAKIRGGGLLKKFCDKFKFGLCGAVMENKRGQTYRRL